MKLLKTGIISLILVFFYQAPSHAVKACKSGEFAAQDACWSCPSGYKHHVLYGPKDSRVCQKKYTDKKKAKFSYKVAFGKTCKKGTFANFGEFNCHKCPKGYKHDALKKVNKKGVCFKKTTAKKPAVWKSDIGLGRAINKAAKDTGQAIYDTSKKVGQGIHDAGKKTGKVANGVAKELSASSQVFKKDSAFLCKPLVRWVKSSASAHKNMSFDYNITKATYNPATTKCKLNKSTKKSYALARVPTPRCSLRQLWDINPWDSCSVPQSLKSEFRIERKMYGPACNAHDVCYRTPGRSKQSCDNDFLSNMNDICKNYGKESQCNVTLTGFYSALISSDAKKAYDKAQQKSRNSAACR